MGFYKCFHELISYQCLNLEERGQFRMFTLLRCRSRRPSLARSSWLSRWSRRRTAFGTSFFYQVGPGYDSIRAQLASENYFHWSMTYLGSSGVPNPYGAPWISKEVAQRKGIPPWDLSYDKEDVLRRKTVKGAVWMVSRCKAASGRERAVAALQEYVSIL